MIGLDTNVLVRYVTQDDSRQSPIATRVFERELSPDNPGFVGLITLCELVWVLEDCYAASRDHLRQVIEGLLTSRQISVEASDLVWRVLRTFAASKADFSDALIGEIASANGAATTLTFDKAASGLPGFKLLP